MRKGISTKKGLAFFLGVACAVLPACQDTSKTPQRDMTVNIASNLVDFSKNADKNVMDIYAFRGPTDLSEEQWNYLKESGINTLIMDSTEGGKVQSAFGASGQEAYIRKCKEYGIQALGYTIGALDGNIKDYSDTDLYDTICGIDYTDEPNMSEFEEIASVIPDFSAKYFGKKFYVCLLSSGAAAQHLGTPNYREYLNTWYDTVLSTLPEGMPRVLATDIYPLLEKTDKQDYQTKDMWLNGLAYMGEQKLKHPELILHMAMQSMSFGFSYNTTPRRLPTVEDCKFQAYVNLAFGFTEFSWFTFSTPPIDEREFGAEHSAMLDRNGQPTQSYYAVKETNQELALLDEVMLALKWHGVYPIQAEEERDKYAYLYLNKVDSVLLEPSDFACVNSITADKNALAGQFTDENGNEGYMLVNYGDPKQNISSTVTLDLIECNKIIVYRNGLPTIQDVVDGNWSIKLNPGEGVYVIPYNE